MCVCVIQRSDMHLHTCVDRSSSVRVSFIPCRVPNHSSECSILACTRIPYIVRFEETTFITPLLQLQRSHKACAVLTRRSALSLHQCGAYSRIPTRLEIGFSIRIFGQGNKSQKKKNRLELAYYQSPELNESPLKKILTLSRAT